MDPPRSQSEEEAALAFSERFSEDMRRGARRNVAEYLRLFPGHENRIAAEFVRLSAASVERSGAGRGDGAESRIGPYRIIRELGRGGQGSVQLAEDERVGRRVAVKLLTGHSAWSATALARFRREAAITARLDHPGICPIYDVGLDCGTPYFAMRYIDGAPLSRIIAATREQGGDLSCTFALPTSSQEAHGPGVAPAPVNGPTTPTTAPEIERIIGLMESAARALHAAHEQGVVHRDVKPGNIMVDSAGRPVLLDFGLAQDVQEDGTALTLTGELMGTPAYMSPEQIAAHRIRLDRRTDVYSLGVALFECLALRRPFDAPTREGLYQAILTHAPPNLRRINRGISDDLRVVVETALEKDRERRYATAELLAEDLRRVRCREPIAARPAGALVKMRRWASRQPALASAAGAGVVLLATALVLLAQTAAARKSERIALAEKSEALVDYERLGAVAGLRALRTEAEAIWPMTEGNRPRRAAWMKRAEDLVKRLPEYESALEALHARPDARELGATDADASTGDDDGSRTSADAQPAGAVRWQYADEGLQFRHDTLARLVADLHQFVDSGPEARGLTGIKARMALAARLARDRDETYAESWRQAAASIGDVRVCPAYRGLRIIAQFGLAPIGVNPSTGLWEFAHLESTAEGFDPIPARRADGSLALKPEHGVILVLLPGGTFSMGARTPDGLAEANAASSRESCPPNVDMNAGKDEGPVQAVAVNPFFMSKYEVTRAQWRRTTKADPRHEADGPLLPVDFVSWFACSRWCADVGLDLPTEAQWEYGCRAGSTTPWWTGTSEISAKEACGEAAASPLDVGSYPANAFGLHDTHGNVFEWCRDAYLDYATTPCRPGDGLRSSSSAAEYRIERGGACRMKARVLRSSNRNFDQPERRIDFVGFRTSRRISG